MSPILVLVVALFACAGGGGHHGPPPIAVCGNHVCEPGETPAGCADCAAPGPVCGDGECDSPETAANCVVDCKPQTVCGNGKCDAGETQETCPVDCKPKPVCGDEPLDPDCPKITRDHSQWISLGLYVGATGQSKFDPVALFQLLKKFNAVAIHELSPWNAEDGYGPFKFDPSKKIFLLSEWNEDWWAHFRLILRAAAYYDHGLELCLLDSYGGSHWQRYHGIAKYSPWRNNDTRDICGDDNCMGFYNNWNRQNPADKKNYRVFNWTDEFKWETYKGTSGAGEAVIGYIKRTAQECAEVRKEFPDFRLLIRSANEGVSYVGADGRTIDYSKKKYLDDRWDILVSGIFKAAGFVVGKSYNYVYTITTLNTDQTWNAYWPEKTMRQFIKPRRVLVTWHNIQSRKDLDFFHVVCGFPFGNFYPSSDGDKEDSEYYDEMRAIAALKLPYFDYKLYAEYDGPDRWRDLDLNWNVQHYVPAQEAAVFAH
jgi:hypothetical protein